jgi:hypothetical protein
MKLVCFLLAVGIGLGAAGHDAAATAGIEVITAEEIQSAGLTRLGDILLLADAWTVGTRDGFDWRASPNGLSTSQQQGWLVMVDGQFMDIRLYDSTNLNLLPVPLAVVDSVEVINLPLLYKGVFTGRGMIHVHTRRPAPGPAFLGEIVAGNETGDPGPYAYTGLSTPNVDAIGPDVALAIGYNRSDAYVQATASTGVHFFRDPAMLERNSAILGPPSNLFPPNSPPQNITPPGRPAPHSVLGRLGFDDVTPGMRKMSATFKAGFEGLAGRHESSAGITETERYFLYIKPLGREIPVNTRFVQAGLRGDFIYSSGATISYRLNYSSHQLNKYPNALDFDPNWDSRVVSSNVEGRQGGDSLSLTGGIGWDRQAPRSRYIVNDRHVNIVRLYTRLMFKPSPKTCQVFGLMAISCEGRTAIKSFLTTAWDLYPDHSLQLHLSFSERLPEEDQGVRYWTQPGIVAPGDLDRVYVTTFHRSKNSQLTADLNWRATPQPSITITSTAAVRFFDDLHLESQAFMFDSTDCAFSSPVFGRGLQAGTVARAQVTAQHQISTELSHRLSYSYQTDIGGDWLFRQAWHTVPEHRASYRIAYRSTRNVDLWGMLSYLSSSSWIDYTLIDGESCESAGTRTVYRSTVDSSLKLDLQVQKWFWQRRLRGELLCWNVWNDQVRYHPVGASFDLSFYVGLSLQLGAY